MINCFTFVQVSILLYSQNYNFEFLYTLDMYLPKLISHSLNHSRKIRKCKNLYIFGALTFLKSQGILL